MTLAPIRGAPPDAPNPDFPIEDRKVEPARPGAAPVSGDHPQTPPSRRRHTPIDIGGGGITLTFRVIPEQPAIARASMHIVANAVGPSSPHAIGSLQMSAGNARTFLGNLRDGRSRIVAAGDEGGTIQIEFEITEGEPVLLVRKTGEPHVLHHAVIDQGPDLKASADELLADLGA